MAYSKLHASIVNSSLWTEADSARILFITLLAVCDKDGFVYGSRPGFERLANIDPHESEEAWAILLSPDPHSSDKIRAPEHRGRRIEEVSGGFRLLNFSYYRGLRDDDDRRRQNREAQTRHRNKNKPPSAAVSQDKPDSAHTEAEAEAEGGSKSPNGRQPSTARMIVLDQELKRIDVKIGDIRNSYDAHQTMDENDREKLKELKAKRAKVRKELGLD